MKIEKLGNIADFKMGQAPHSDTYNDKGEGTLLIKAGDFGFHYPTPIEYTTKPISFSEEGDILICVVGATSGKVNKGINASITRSIAAIRVHQGKLNSDFLFYYLRSSYNRLNKMTSGSAQGIISKPILAKIEVPLPHLTDQLYIANLLSKAETLIYQRKESILLLDQYLKSTFLEMFGDPVRNEKGWKISKFKDLAFIDRKQVLPSEFTNDDFYIGLEDIEKETGNIIKKTIENAEDLKSSKFRFTPNHILYAKLRPYLNKVALPSQLGICSTDIFPILPLDGKSTRDFICFLMRSKPFVSEMHSKSSGANLPRASASIIENFKTYQPPFSLQTQFAHIVEKTEALKAQYQQSLQELENLYGSLSQKAFKGELTMKEEYLSQAAEPSMEYKKSEKF